MGTRTLIVGLLPIIMMSLLILCYVLPQRLKEKYDMLDDNEFRNRRLMSNKRFIKLLLFTVFLLFPHVSSMVVSVYNCRYVDGQYYLLKDFRVLCMTPRWWAHASVNIIFVLMYPIGIPLIYFYKLKKTRDQHQEPLVQLELGFLYRAYSSRRWWFECADMLFKLFLTSVIVFLPNHMELGAGMLFTTGYTIILLLSAPYVRNGDFRLHLMVQSELLCIYMIAYIMESNGISVMDSSIDISISVILIIMVIFIMIVFITMSAKSLYKLMMLYRRRNMLNSEPDRLSSAMKFAPGANKFDRMKGEPINYV